MKVYIQRNHFIFLMYINNDIKKPRKKLNHPYGKTEELCRVLGSKYTFTMLFMLEEKACRFKDFDTALDNFSQSSLSRRLKKLQILDFIKQKPNRSKRRDIEEYVLTLRGEKFMRYFLDYEKELSLPKEQSTLIKLEE